MILITFLKISLYIVKEKLYIVSVVNDEQEERKQKMKTKNQNGVWMTKAAMARHLKVSRQRVGQMVQERKLAKREVFGKIFVAQKRRAI